MDTLEPSGEARALLILDSLPGVGPARVARLVRRFGSAERALAAPPRAVAELVGREAAAARGDPELARDVDRALARARELGMRLLTWTRPEYPARLRRLADPPPVLFLRGDARLLSREGVAVVGSRRATVRGRDVARRIGFALARRGVPVVSGMALGVDAAAHRGALEAGGPTVAVLGRGADRAYPYAHRALFSEILATGLVVTEFLPGTPPLPHHFPRRNRVLAALSESIVVVEAGARSGALITVDHALDLGLDVYAVPGPVDAPSCRGSNAMLRDGARALVDAEEFAEQVAPGAHTSRETGPSAGAEGRVLAALDPGGGPVDEVARRTGLAAAEALAVLTRLELRGWVERAPGARFRRVG